MKKILSIFLLIIVVSLASTAAYIYFSTKSAVDSMISSVRPFANIKYQRFSNPFDGSISIHGVTVGDGYGTNIDVGSIEFKLHSVLDYINFDKKISSGEILPKLQLQINHVYTDLALLSSVDPENIEQAPLEEVIDRIAFYTAALGCGDVKEMGLNNLSDLGYSGLDGSLNIDFEYDKLSSEVDMELGLIMHGMASYAIRTSLPNIYSAEDFVNPNNKISNLEIEVQDLGYNDSVIEYCTRQSKLETDAYVDLHMQELKKYLTDANITLSDEVYDTYRAYFVDKATLTFRGEPASAVNLQYINLYETKDWANILGLSVYVNDQQVENFVFEWDKNTALQNLLNAQLSEEEVAVMQKKKQQYTRQAPRTYSEIPVNDLDNHINSQVKLETKLGKIYTGYVKGVTRSQIIVVIRLKGGKAEIPVGTNKIAKAYIAN